MLILEPPEAELQYPTRPRAVLACNTTARGVLVPLAFIFLLIGLCTLYALKTRLKQFFLYNLNIFSFIN